MNFMHQPRFLGFLFHNRVQNDSDKTISDTGKNHNLSKYNSVACGEAELFSFVFMLPKMIWQIDVFIPRRKTGNHTIHTWKTSCSILGELGNSNSNHPVALASLWPQVSLFPTSLLLHLSKQILSVNLNVTNWYNNKI